MNRLTGPTLSYKKSKFTSSIYGKIVGLITIMSVLFFILLAIFLFNINRTNLENIIEQMARRVSITINSSLHKSMLSNDTEGLRYTISEIGKLPGISSVRIFDREGKLKHTSYDTLKHYDEVVPVHAFDKVIIDSTKNSKETIEYEVIKDIAKERLLIISKPILNEPSCVQSTCHIHNDDEILLGSLEAMMSLAETDRGIRKTEITYLIFVIIFLGIASFVLIEFTRRKIQKPLLQIVNASNEVALGNLDIRIPVDTFDLNDIYLVGSAFNNMLEKIHDANKQLRSWSKNLEEKVRTKTEELKRTQSELIKIEKMASLGKLSSAVAHEINNPLSGVLTYTKLIIRQLEKSEISDKQLENIFNHLNMIETETKRCGNIVKGLLDFSRENQLQFETASLNQIVKETISLTEHSFDIAQIQLESSYEAKHDLIWGNPNQLKQALMSVMVNSQEAIDADGLVKVETYNSRNNKEIVVEISDTGIGIHKEDIGRIFEPFFSRKDTGASTGLGLAVTYGIIQQHNGQIRVNSKFGKGTQIIIVLPVHIPKKG
ncbi:sensor histidine kinase [Candidatus Neomarinimicrobiota bacterium]